MRVRGPCLHGGLNPKEPMPKLPCTDQSQAWPRPCSHTHPVVYVDVCALMTIEEGSGHGDQDNPAGPGLWETFKWGPCSLHRGRGGCGSQEG